MSFVLDNSVAMRWFFGDGSPRDMAYAGRVLDAMKADEALVPGLWGLEVANVLACAEAAGLVSEARSETFLGMLHKLNISVDPSTATHALATTLQLARRHKLSAYDAAYLELALRNGLPLATLDEKLLKAARKSDVNIFAIKPG
ncbi:MAG: type II toxin-antitoxin system VapC family toxin [Sulfurisoma sp.]|nr:type II toxin-antitoxin system VapC family toxin [Sulfurisoma sp.]